MQTDDLARLKAEVVPQWDDLREQRVLGAVLEQRRMGQVRTKRVARVAMLAAAVVLGVTAAGVVRSRAPIASVLPAPPSTAESSVIALPDGSRVTVGRDAALEVEEQRVDSVRIAQRSGSVRYEVRHDPSREFTVHAGDTWVRVRGTLFTVDVSANATEVHVDRGRVEVEASGRKHELVTGETLRVPTTGEVDTEPPSSGSAGDGTPPEPPPSPLTPSAAGLQAAADSARLSGHNAEAAAALERLVNLYPSDSRVPNVLFTLGRVERARGRDAASAQAFQRCYKAAPRGPLAEDAMAEAAVSWANAGRRDEAKSQARGYVARWPEGPNASRMHEILTP